MASGPGPGLVLAFLFAFMNQRKNKKPVVVMPSPSPAPNINPPTPGPPVVLPAQPSSAAPIATGQTSGPVKGSTGGGSSIVANAGQALGTTASSYATSQGVPPTTGQGASGQVSADDVDNPAASSGSEATEDAGGDLGKLAGSMVSGPATLQPYVGNLPPGWRPLGRASAAEINWAKSVAPWVQPWHWMMEPTLQVALRREPGRNGQMTTVLWGPPR